MENYKKEPPVEARSIKSVIDEWRESEYSPAKYFKSSLYQLFSFTLLILSLFLSLGWRLGNGVKSGDDAIFGVLIAIFIIFMIEILVLSIFVKKYFLSFLFWRDLIGTGFILLDVGWVIDTLQPNQGIQQGAVVRASRAAELGIRYGRLSAFFRLVRLCGMHNLFPSLAGGQDINSSNEAAESSLGLVGRLTESLAAALSARVVALVIILVVVLPYMSYSPPFDIGTRAWIDALSITATNNQTSLYDIELIVDGVNSFFMAYDDKPIYIRVDTPWGKEIERYYITRSNLRSDSIESYSGYYYAYPNHTYTDGAGDAAATGLQTNQIYLEMDITHQIQSEAFFGIMIVILVLIILSVFSSSFHRVVKRIVVAPLKTVVKSLRTSTQIMLGSLKILKRGSSYSLNKESSSLSDDEFILNSLSGKGESSSGGDDDQEGIRETFLLERVVGKISRIMKHMSPEVGASHMILGEDVDKNTAHWLRLNYEQQQQQQEQQPRGTGACTPLGPPAGASSRNMQKTASQRVVKLDVLNSWDFDPLTFTHEELSTVCTYILSVLLVLDEFEVSMSVQQGFMREIMRLYRSENPYHNFSHGCDVFHTTYRMIVVPDLVSIFSQVEIFAMLIGALAHDVGHLGVNNAFLIKSRDPLALLHNDRSPLENMHCTLLYDVLRRKETNIFSGMNDAQWREARRIIISCILGTDMNNHFDQVSKAQLFLEVNGSDTRSFCSCEKETIDAFTDDNKRLFIMELLMHCADISNPGKPFPVYKKWATLVCEEFCLQGDREKNEGLEVSPMMDRDQMNLPNMQLGFIEFVVVPLYSTVIKVFPPLHDLGINLQDGYTKWAGMRRAELRIAGGPDCQAEMAKLDERVSKFQSKMGFLFEFTSMKKRRGLLRRNSSIMVNLLTGGHINKDHPQNERVDDSEIYDRTPRALNSARLGKLLSAVVATGGSGAGGAGKG